MRTYYLAIAVILVIGLVGCGDDDGGNNDNTVDAGANQNDSGATQNDSGTTQDDGGSNNNNASMEVLGDLDGTFEITAILVPSDSETWTRTEASHSYDGTPVMGMIRGYVDFTATDDEVGEAVFRFGLIADRALDFYVDIPDLEVTYEPASNKLIFSLPDMDAVHLIEYDGSVLTLTLDENDIRNEQALEEWVPMVELTRVTPTANELTGTWSYASITMGQQPPVTITDGCSATGGEWQRLSGMLNIDDMGYVSGQVAFNTFDNSACSGSPTNTSSSQFIGFCDVDETNHTFDQYQWMVVEDMGLGGRYDYSLAGTTLTLTTVSVYPSGMQGAPSEVILEKN